MNIRRPIQNLSCFFLMAVVIIPMTVVIIPKSLQADDDFKTVSKLFEDQCNQCHSGWNPEADIDLGQLNTDSDFLKATELLEKIIGVIDDRSMPPEDEEPLSNARRKEVLGALKRTLARSLKSRPFKATPIRRMNRFQYNNAVVDLLELERDIFQLNERLMRRRSDYFQPSTRKMPDQVRVSSRPLSKDVDSQRPEGFFGVAAFPQDKRAEHGFDNRADHLTMSPLLMESFLKLSQTIVESQDLNARECRSWNWLFSPPGVNVGIGSAAGILEAELASVVRIQQPLEGRIRPQEMTSYGPQWSNDRQLIWLCPNKDLDVSLSFTVDVASKGINLGLTRAPDYGTFDVYIDGKKTDKRIDLFDTKVSHIQHKLSALNLAPGTHKITFKCIGRNARSTKYYFGLDYIQLTGRKAEPKPAPEEVSDADAIDLRLKRFLRRAFRRPVDAETLKRFSSFAKSQLDAGVSFEETMRTIVGAVLGMPEFLYLYEKQKETADEKFVKRVPVDDFELATRLSQFFWSSIPDDVLLDLAAAGKLSDPTVLEQQIDRMMDDRKSARFCDNFPGQWLQLERLITSVPDKKQFPYFYLNGYRTSLHMISEPLLLFETVFVEDRSVMDLIAPDFSYRSHRLNSNYEGKNQGGGEVQIQVFRRIPISDSRWGGVITNAAVMTMTSTPTRTQPITRGAWVNAVIFNDPPEPPPADVPELPEVDKQELEKLTIRERLAVHRTRADCAGCHNKIDPLGFALENYGPTGVWRDRYVNNREVDVAGVFFNQYKFSTVTEFKKLVVKEKHRFIRAFASHLLSYALARELGPVDSPSLDLITEKALAGEDSLRSIMKNIALSEAFLHKR